MRWILLLLLILALTLTPAGAQGPQEGHNQIQTMGMGRVEVSPDQVILTVGTSVQRQTANEAWTATSKVASQVLARLTQLGIRKDQIRTSGIHLFPIYVSPPNDPWQAGVSGYRAIYTATLTLDDLSLVGRAIDAAVEAGATGLQGIVFGLKDPAKARKEALTLAVRDAKEKAEVIAQASGLRIRNIDRIIEGGVNIQPVMRVPPAGMPMPGVKGGMAASDVEPGMVTVYAQVQAAFNY